jgi:sulfur carrier protein
MPERLREAIEIRLNGKVRSVPPGLTVRGLLESLDLRPELVVVELNRDILRREAYGEVPVREGDVLELVHFVGGG